MDGIMKITESLHLKVNLLKEKYMGLEFKYLIEKTQDSIKKSLFFSFENGRVRQVADHDFNFDVNLLLPGKSIITSET